MNKIDKLDKELEKSPGEGCRVAGQNPGAGKAETGGRKQLITIACTILVLLPKVEWSNEWGKLLRTAATTNALSEYQSSVLIYYDIFSEYTPIELILLEILLCTLICTFVGVLMFFV